MIQKQFSSKAMSSEANQMLNMQMDRVDRIGRQGGFDLNQFGSSRNV